MDAAAGTGFVLKQVIICCTFGACVGVALRTIHIFICAWTAGLSLLVESFQAGVAA